MGITSQPFRLHGYVTTKYHICGKTVSAPLYFADDSIFENAQYTVLVGNDTLQQFGKVTFDYENCSVTVGNITCPIFTPKSSPPEELLKIRVKDQTSIPAYSQKRVDVKSDVPLSQLPQCYLVDAVSDRLVEQYGTFITPAVLDPINPQVHVTNPTAFEVTLYANTCLAVAEAINEQEADCDAKEEREEGNTPQPNLAPELSANHKSQLQNLCKEFQDIFSKHSLDIGCCKIDPLHIKTSSSDPIYTRPRRLNEKYREELQNYIDKMVQMGILEECDTPWVSAIVIVTKKDGSIRPCIDYRRLNKTIIPDHYPVPRIESLIEKLAGVKYLSSIDFTSGFLQIPVDEESSRKLGIITESKTFKCNRVPFGTRNSGALFMRALAKVFSGLERFTVVYIDDVLIFSKSDDFLTHVEQLRQVFQRLREFNLKISPKKTKLGFKQLKFLGHTIRPEGYSPDEENLRPIREFPEPKNLEETKRFLGMSGYFRKFIRSYSLIAEPLNRLSRKGTPFHFGLEQQNAFKRLRQRLSETPILSYPDYNRPFHVTTDASSVAIGAVLTQQRDDPKEPHAVIGYFSASLSATERRWPPVQQELAAIVLGLEHFKPYILFGKVHLHTDHKPLIYLVNKANTSSHLFRWLVILQQYDITVTHVAGRDNLIADALSRAPIENKGQIDSESSIEALLRLPSCLTVTNSSVPFESEMQRSQKADRILSEVIALHTKEKDKSSNEEVNEYFAITQYTDNFGLILKNRREPVYIVPSGLRPILFEHFHCSPISGGHFSIRKLKHKMRHYYWLTMYQDIKQAIAQCRKCQERAIAPKANRLPLIPVITKTPFAKVAIDLSGPYRKTKLHNRYILNIIDHFSKYLVSVAVPDMTAKTVAHALVNHFYLIYGSPTEITSDNQSNFTSEFFLEIHKLLNIHKRFSTPYHSAGNGACERSFRTVENMLAKFTSQLQDDYDSFLPSIAFAYNSTFHETTMEMPYFLVFGRDPVLPIEPILHTNRFFTYNEGDIGDYKRMLMQTLRAAYQSAAETLAKNATEMKERYDKRSKTTSVVEGALVMLRRRTVPEGINPKLLPRWTGIYRVISVEVPHATIVSLENPRQYPIRVHLNQVKIYHPPISPLYATHSDVTRLAPPGEDAVIGLPGYDHTITADGQMPPQPIDERPAHSYNLRNRRRPS